MSTLRSGSLIVGVSTAATFIATNLLEIGARETLCPEFVRTLILAVGVVSWITYIATVCVDQIAATMDRHTRTVLGAFADAVDEVGNRRATAARIDMIRQHQGQDPPRRLHPVDT